MQHRLALAVLWWCADDGSDGFAAGDALEEVGEWFEVCGWIEAERAADERLQVGFVERGVLSLGRGPRVLP